MDEKRDFETTGETDRDSGIGAGGGPRPEDRFGHDHTLWDKVRRGVADGYQFAADKTDLYARIASRRVSILGINRKIDRSYTELGEKVYNLLAADESAPVASDPAVKELASRIRAGEEDLTRKEAEIEEIRHEYRTRMDAQKEEV